MYNYTMPDLASAFDAYVDQTIPNVISELRCARDYTDHADNWTLYPTVRGLTTVINWKSNVGNADMTHTFRTKLSSDIQRGDLVYDAEQDLVGMVNWNIDMMVDCKKTQIAACNSWIVVYRHTPEVVDKRGFLVTDAFENIIVNRMPCVYVEMYGKIEYEKGTNSPGIIPEQAVEVKVQANPETINIQTGDYFSLHNIPHKVLIVNKSQTDASGEHGVIAMICERGENT